MVLGVPIRKHFRVGNKHPLDQSHEDGSNEKS